MKTIEAKRLSFDMKIGFNEMSKCGQYKRRQFIHRFNSLSFSNSLFLLFSLWHVVYSSQFSFIHLFTCFSKSICLFHRRQFFFLFYFHFLPLFYLMRIVYWFHFISFFKCKAMLMSFPYDWFGFEQHSMSSKKQESRQRIYKMKEEKKELVSVNQWKNDRDKRQIQICTYEIPGFCIF